MREIGIILFALLLSGCAEETGWMRAGTSQETATQDLADCRSLAGAKPNDAAIDADIQASRGHDWENTGVQGIERQRFAADEKDQGGDPVAQCMIAKGYAPAR